MQLGETTDGFWNWTSSPGNKKCPLFNTLTLILICAMVPVARAQNSPLEHYSPKSPQPRHFSVLSSVAVDASKNLRVADTCGNRIQEFANWSGIPRKAMFSSPGDNIDTPMQWWIQTWNDAGYGPWSDGMSFVVSLRRRSGSRRDGCTLVAPVVDIGLR